MYDNDKVKDSLEFVNKIYLYEKCDPDRVSDMMKMQNVRKIDVDIHDETEDKQPEEHVYEDKYYMSENDVVEKEHIKAGIMDFLYVLGCVLVSVAIAFFITRYIAHHTKVEGSSMNETLYDGDYLIIEKMSYYFEDPSRFDIIVFPYSNDVYYIKRVIGLPGEKVQIINGKVYIDDELLEEDVYGNNLISDPGIAKEPMYLADDEVFVLGDNRNSSIDSRRANIGPVDIEKIEGRAFFRMWPFSSVGGIE